MALNPCAYCNRVPRGPIGTLIWAWYTDGTRVAYRTRCCFSCFADAAAPWGDPLPVDGEYIQLPTACGRCTEPLSRGEAEVTYMTAYVGQDATKYEYGHCTGCALLLHHEVVGVGEPMPDRPLYGRR